ncbi:nucleoside hydrolase [Neorhizobium galegae]|uniref:nucleoside hydrolase n=1 Tax=Neorhizobium galegae TaxID=399 RepID=UPI00210538A9|nr:nucleoside hydrolase [Neorhizobium galegae]MCQ1838747.1 nucleoside hydrolase [Neorhizobium galegae]UIY32134.1 nucleoside hydrolase [Neorhizobium galegae]
MADANVFNDPEAARKCAEASRFYLAAYREQHPDISDCALHDPLAVAVALDPGPVTLEPMQVDVEYAPASFRAAR